MRRFFDALILTVTPGQLPLQKIEKLGKSYSGLTRDDANV
jgi:hypothetical protein